MSKELMKIELSLLPLNYKFAFDISDTFSHFSLPVTSDWTSCFSPKMQQPACNFHLEKRHRIGGI